jgi:hypothetical protein
MDWLFSQLAGRYDHCRVFVTVLVKIWTNNETTEPDAVATQPRAAPTSQIYLFSLMHTSQGWCKWIRYFPNKREDMAIR